MGSQKPGGLIKATHEDVAETLGYSRPPITTDLLISAGWENWGGSGPAGAMAVRPRRAGAAR
ncbi:hypothetical protein TNCT6_12830 [Streptomyces sp. 6-11-2]|nr:hypothetical protein TNCT6_12830 [Streptomyces sp. 6-11-2]